MSYLHLDGSKLFWHLDRLTDWYEGKEIAPVHIEISPTSSCNYRCIFCYADYAAHTRTYLEPEMYLKLMRDMGEMGVRSCLLAGDGEPLLHKQTAQAIAEGKKSGVDMALNTNGLLLNEEFCVEALPHLTWLRVSVMAFSPEVYGKLHGTSPHHIESVKKNLINAVRIKNENNYPVTIGLQQVLLPENTTEVYALASWAKEAGLDYYVLKPFSLHGCNEHYREGVSAVALKDAHEHELRKAEALTDSRFSVIIRWNTFSDDGQKEYGRCLGLPFIAQIGADGKVYTCCPFFGQEDFAYGDLHSHSLRDIWYSERAIGLRRSMAESFELDRCMTYCRHHQINKQLWGLRHPPRHINFI